MTLVNWESLVLPFVSSDVIAVRSMTSTDRIPYQFHLPTVFFSHCTLNDLTES